MAAIQPKSGVVDPINLVLYSVELDQLTLSEGIAAYGDAEDPHLPVGELTRLLEMEIDVFPAEGRVIGRVGEARRSLVIDLSTGTAREGGRSISLSNDDVAITASEIYIRASALQRLLPVKFEMNVEALSLKIVPQEPLPIQSRLQRMVRQRSLRTDPTADAETLLVVSPYRLFSLPSFDIQVGSGLQSVEPRTPLRYDVRAAADLLYGNFQGYVGSDETGAPSSARLLLERRSVPGHLLGPLKARVLSLGDVYTPTLSLGPRGVGGRGFSVSTVPLDQTNIFNRIDLRGELPLGYDAELYINDVLRSGQNTPAQGRYEFLNVPLSPGINVVRIVTYGPRGERSEQTRIINVGGGLLRRGEMTFEFGVVDQDKEVIAIDRGDSGSVLEQEAGGLRAVAAVNYGLTSYLTLSAGAAYVPVRDQDPRQVYNFGVRTSLFGFATQLDLAGDDRGGSGAFLGMAGRVAGASVVLRHAEFRGGFLDENGPGFDLGRPTARRTELTADASVEFAGRIIPVSTRAARYEYADGVDTITASLRVSSTIADFLVSTGLEYERNSTALSTTQRLTGYLATSTFRDYTWQLRATVDYDLLPEVSARSLSVTADRDISPTWGLRFGIGQPLDDLKSTNFTASSIHRLRFGDLAVSGEYNNADKNWRLGAQLNFGLAYSPWAHRYQVSRPGAGSGGSVLFHAFMDDNANGEFDEGEEPVGNVVLEGGERRAVTGPDGRAFVPNVGAGATARLIVGLDEIENPSVQTPPTTIELRPRPGATMEVKFPMRPTGDLMVKLVLRRPDKETVGLAAARVVLVGENGRTFEAGTEYDGTAAFIGLPVGTYRVELEPGQAKRLRMRLAAPVTAVVESDGGFGSDVQAEVIFEPRSQDEEQQSTDLEDSSGQATE